MNFYGGGVFSLSSPINLFAWFGTFNLFLRSTDKIWHSFWQDSLCFCNRWHGHGYQTKYLVLMQWLWLIPFTHCLCYIQVRHLGIWFPHLCASHPYKVHKSSEFNKKTFSMTLESHSNLIVKRTGFIHCTKPR